MIDRTDVKGRNGKSTFSPLLLVLCAIGILSLNLPEAAAQGKRKKRAYKTLTQPVKEALIRHLGSMSKVKSVNGKMEAKYSYADR